MKNRKFKDFKFKTEYKQQDLFVCKKLDMHTLIKCALNQKNAIQIALFWCANLQEKSKNKKQKMKGEIYHGNKNAK